MKKVILCPNPYRDKGLAAAKRADEILRGVGLSTVFCLPFKPESEGNYGVPCRPLQQEMRSSDLVVAFGGDGTILHLARAASMRGLPVLGVNLGSLGFMSDLELGELELLKKLASGQYRREKRMMLDVAVLREGRTVYTGGALNDAVITKGAVARVIDLQIFGDKSRICNTYGDGVIMATPTGSTAYSLSAGGPIVEPMAENIIMTPISAHTLQAKAMVLDRNRLIDVVLPKNSRKTAYLSVDGGKAFKLYPGDTVQVARSRRSLRLVKLSDKSFYEVLNRKLERRIRL